MRWLLLIPFALIAACDRDDSPICPAGQEWRIVKYVPGANDVQCISKTANCTTTQDGGQTWHYAEPVDGACPVSKIYKIGADELRRRLVVEPEHMDQVCAALEPIYKKDRVKIGESDGLVFWCNFNPPRLPALPEGVSCLYRESDPKGVYDCHDANGRPTMVR